MLKVILRLSSITAVCATLLALTGCRQDPGTQPFLGEFAMGQRVQVGPFIYTVLESKWTAKLSDDPQTRIPKNRFLIIRMSVTNAGGEDASFPVMTIQTNTGVEIPELMEGVSEVPNWFAPLARSMRPAQSESGTIVFDAPLGAYKLKLREMTESDQPRFALVDIPVQLE